MRSSSQGAIIDKSRIANTKRILERAVEEEEDGFGTFDNPMNCDMTVAGKESSFTRPIFTPVSN